VTKKRIVSVYKRTWPQGYKAPVKTELVGTGVFHCWGSSYEEFEDGPVSYTMAIVELRDGSIITPNPQDIVFFNPE